MFNLNVYNRTREKISKNFFSEILISAEKNLVKTGKILPRQNFSLDLTFVTNKEITELNKKHRGIDSPTDVISISYSDLTFDEFIGEIFISLPFAKMQAEKIGNSLEEEVKFLFIHGLLHVFGFDHVKQKEACVMENLTYRILEVPNKGK